MIERIEFKNYKALRSAVLPLGRFTLLVGPNGSGKTTALKALEAVRSNDSTHASLVTAGVSEDASITIWFGEPNQGSRVTRFWSASAEGDIEMTDAIGQSLSTDEARAIIHSLARSQVYSLDADQISNPVELLPDPKLLQNGAGLAGVLDNLRDAHHERFSALQGELPHWFPEYASIHFEVSSPGMRNFYLRTQEGRRISAADLSHGTLLALAMLTLAHLPDPPPIIGFEEPDRGIHPRLLREVQDALYRLAFPESVGESRAPVQVIATTHSPYLLDLFKDHPEEIVIAQRSGTEATFERLSEHPHLEQILDGASLGDVWYSGILGGVPVAP